MSAIYGAVSRRGKPLDEQAIARMASRLAYRGPDGHEVLRRPELVFGQLRLRTDQPGPPAPRPRGGLLLTCDARLIDRGRLAERLDLPDVDARSDADLIGAAWQRWQTECPQHLQGDFAFCLWDEARGQLFCARDRLGIKPLAYAVTPDLLLFASEPSAIDAYLGGAPISRSRVAEYLLSLEAVDFTRTFFEGVSRLPPAHSLTLDSRGMAVRRYWRPRILQTPSREPGELVELGRSLLEQSVRQARSRTSTTACLLSGGLDSATVFDLLGRQTDDMLACSATSAEPDCADTLAIERLTASVPSASLQVRAEDTGAWLPSVLPLYARLDDPFASVMTLAGALYRAAAARGARVVLDGMEGDLVYSLFASYPQALFNEGRPGAAFSELWHLSREGYAPPFPRQLARFLAGRLLPDGIRTWRQRRFRTRALQDALAGSVLSAELRHDPAVLDQLARQSDVPEPADTVALHRHWLEQPILVTAIERYDRMAASCGVEARHPLLDVDLVEFALNLPWYMKRCRAVPKRILREVTAGRLPDAIRLREDKPHLGWRFNEMVMLDQWETMRRRASASDERLAAWVDLPAALRCFDKGAYDVDAPSTLPWDLNALLQWLEGLDHRANGP